jgi:hypothetical protein
MTCDSALSPKFEMPIMNEIPAYRWRKATDINREYALFELLENGSPVLDVGFSDEGLFEVCFNPSIAGKVMEGDKFMKLLAEGRALAVQDR